MWSALGARAARVGDSGKGFLVIVKLLNVCPKVPRLAHKLDERSEQGCVWVALCVCL